MTELNEALFRIDPTEGLLKYVEAVKPFHSKVLDVLVEYVYGESMVVSASDRSLIDVGLTNEDDELITYTCGFGYIWNPYSSASGADLPQATILKAVGPIRFSANVTAGTSNITIANIPELSNYTLSVGEEVVFETTGTFPTASVSLTPGRAFFITSIVGSVITVSSTVGGTPVTFTTTGTGSLSLIPTAPKYNTFLVSMSAQTQYDCVVSSIQNNQLTITRPYNIVAVTASARQFFIAGNLQTGTNAIAIGDTIYVTGNTDSATNSKYTVSNCVYNSGTGRTTITVTESVSLSATVSGRINVPVTADDVPYWPAGTAVRVTTTGTYPYPLEAGKTYYFNPTPEFGVFNLAYVRYPRLPTDIVDLMSVSNNQVQIFKFEPFIPGEMVVVTDSYNALNDTVYTINTIRSEGPNFRIGVSQHVQQTTPLNLSTDGTMTYSGSFGDPYCAVAHAPSMYVASTMHERITFEFEGLLDP